MRQNSASVYWAGRVSAALGENAPTPTRTTAALINRFLSIGIQKQMILAPFQIRKGTKAVSGVTFHESRYAGGTCLANYKIGRRPRQAWPPSRKMSGVASTHARNARRSWLSFLLCLANLS